jgi:amino acid adenylation domain-containing protein/non-ribosomal peptide synthase protein (TIGR01720 family)
MSNINDQIAALSPEKRELLIKLLRQKTQETPARGSIPRREGHPDIPLSFAQERLWFLNQMEPENPFYNLPVALRLDGPLNVSALERSINEIVRRHEALRTTFVEKDGVPRQVVHPADTLFPHPAPLPLERGSFHPADTLSPHPVPLPLERGSFHPADTLSPLPLEKGSCIPLQVMDISGLPETEQGPEIRRIQIQETLRPFDLSAGPMLRTLLLRLGSESHVLLAAMHHIVFDGWSKGIFINELRHYYGEFSVNKTPSPLPDLPVQYGDFALWQREWVQGEGLQSQLEYWTKHLSGLAPVMELPTDRPRPAEMSFKGSAVGFAIDPGLTEGLKTLGRGAEATLFMTLLAAFAALLSRYTGSWDIAAGSPVAGRTRKEIEPLIGFFVNTLVLRTDLTGDPSFTELIRRVRRASLDAFANQDLPFERLVNALEVERSLSHNPLFQVVFALQNAPYSPPELPGLSLSIIELEPLTTQFDLTLYLSEKQGGLDGTLEYNSDLFDRDTILRLVANFKTLLTGAVRHPDIPVSGLPLVSETEKELMLTQFNQTARDYPRDKTVVDLFESHAEKNPDNPAVVFGNVRLTYGQLNQWANRIAHHLQTVYHIQPDDRVGVLADRSDGFIAAILGILKAGGAYVPLAPSYPAGRIAYMVQDSGCRVVLTEPDFRHLAPDVPVENIRDMDGSEENPARSAGPQNLVYVIYTSGSTGEPKGVQIEHGSLVNLAVWHQRTFDIQESSRSTLYASVGFDASVWETWAYLAHGACLFPLTDDQRLDLETVTDFFRTHRITHAFLPPALCELFLNLDLSGLEGMVLHAGGDTLRNLQPRPIRMINNYGPTESTVAATSNEVDFYRPGTVHIGRPIHNTQIYILDVNRRLVPIGVKGEICIGGDSLARGYLNKPELTREKFFPHPFKTGERLYATGDLGRWLADGNIEFLGREDDQVKVRGYRIELGEIEQTLLRHDKIKEAVVLKKTVFRTDELTAYVVGPDESDEKDIRAHLGRSLPDYMIPSRFILMDSLPFTPNGKIDKKALPDPDQGYPGARQQAGAPPRNDREAAIVSVWAELLKKDRVGIDDSYFALGGDSIMAIQVVSRLKRIKPAGWRMEVRDLFKYPTAEQLAPHLTPYQEEQAHAAAGAVPLTPVQKWFFKDVEIGPYPFNQAVLLKGKVRFDAVILKKILQALHDYHDSLRMQYQFENGHVIQIYADPPPSIYFEFLDLTGNPSPVPEMEAHVGRLQHGMDLKNGPLFKCALYRLDDADRLLITIQHLVVDLFSMRILLEDLSVGYAQALQGNSIVFPPKSSSYQEWTEKIHTYGHSGALNSEKDYWRKMASAPAAALPSDMKGGQKLEQQTHLLSVFLSPEETRNLLTTANRPFDTQATDLMLAGLALASQKWTGQSATNVLMAGHGREHIVPGIDISRTVGWFSVMYPMPLAVPENRDPALLIRRVRDNFKAMPAKGMGYSILRYILEEPELTQNPWPEIFFNYIGQFDAELDTPWFTAAPEAQRETHSPSQTPCALDLVTVVMAGRFMIFADYDATRFSEKTIYGFLEDYREALREVIGFCTRIDL